MILCDSGTNLYDIMKEMPAWMVFVSVLLVLFSPIIMEIVKNIRKKKEDDHQKNFVREIKGFFENNQIFSENFKLYLEKLDTLLDLLYEKYANNLDLETSKKILELVYDRSCNKILSHLVDYISEEGNYDENNILSLCGLDQDLESEINNRYYADLMTLNKVACKGIYLDLHMLEISPAQVKKDIMEYLLSIKEKKDWDIYYSVKRFVENYFTTLTNKAHTKLENTVKPRTK